MKKSKIVRVTIFTKELYDLSFQKKVKVLKDKQQTRYIKIAIEKCERGIDTRPNTKLSRTYCSVWLERGLHGSIPVPESGVTSESLVVTVKPQAQLHQHVLGYCLQTFHNSQFSNSCEERHQIEARRDKTR